MLSIRNVTLSLYEAVQAYRVVKHRGSHILYIIIKEIAVRLSA
jgi:hypothetical protein